LSEPSTYAIVLERRGGDNARMDRDAVIKVLQGRKNKKREVCGGRCMLYVVRIVLSQPGARGASSSFRQLLK